MYINKIVRSVNFQLLDLQYANKLDGQACGLFYFYFTSKTQSKLE
jgi:hypothetical protein